MPTKQLSKECSSQSDNRSELSARLDGATIDQRRITPIRGADVRGRSMKGAITDLIRDAIVDGVYPLGSKISEKNLSNELGVSRTPVREALQVLQAEGLIIIKPQSGTFVFRMSAGEILAVCEMRLVLETAALKLGAERHHIGLVDRLERVLEDAAKLLQSDLEKAHRLDTHFHRILIEGSGNPFLVDSYRKISDRLHALRQLLPLTKARLSNALKDHTELVRALVERDISHGEQLIIRHIKNVEHMLLERLKRGASPPTAASASKHSRLRRREHRKG